MNKTAPNYKDKTMSNQTHVEASRSSDTKVGRKAIALFIELKKQGFSDKKDDRQAQFLAKKAFLFNR